MTTRTPEAPTSAAAPNSLSTMDVAALQKELSSLEGRSRELAACLKAMTLVGSSLDLDEVLDRAIISAMEVMNAEAASVLLLDEATGELYFTQAAGSASAEIKEIRIPPGQGIAGWVATRGEPLVIEDAQNDDRFYKGADKATGFVTRTILAVPLVVKDRIIGVAEAINKRGGPFRESDLPLFSAYAALAGVAIENARLHHKLIEQEIVAREIEIAKEIQNALLGPETAVLGKYRFFGSSTPARSVGGDFFDWIHLGDGRAMVALGDVSSKGIPAAMLMSNTLSQLRTIAMASPDPASCLTSLNRTLIPHISRGMFVTIFIAFLEPDGEIRYSSAGHPLPVYIRGRAHRELERVRNPPVGIVPDHYFSMASHRLEDGDLLVVFSDGVSEAANRGREFFGIERLRDTCLENASTPEHLVPRIRNAVDDFEAGAEQSDDLTVAVVAYGERSSRLVLDYPHMTAEELGEIRLSFDKFLAELTVPEKVRLKLVLAIDEACANVIRHAYGGKGGPTRIEFKAEGSELEITIIDQGCGAIPSLPKERCRELKPGGLGLVILGDVMNEVAFERGEGGGCVLKMKKALDGKAGNP